MRQFTSLSLYNIITYCYCINNHLHVCWCLGSLSFFKSQFLEIHFFVLGAWNIFGTVLHLCLIEIFHFAPTVLEMRSSVHVLSQRVGGCVYIGLLTPNKMWLHSLIT